MLAELLATEGDYITSLKFVVSEYINPLRELPNALCGRTLESIFANLEDLIPMAEHLLRHLQGLEDLPEEIQTVGQTFQQLLPVFLEAYSVYTKVFLTNSCGSSH